LICYAKLDTFVSRQVPGEQRTDGADCFVEIGEPEARGVVATGGQDVFTIWRECHVTYLIAEANETTHFLAGFGLPVPQPPCCIGTA
jgi:hypothetical protein